MGFESDNGGFNQSNSLLKASSLITVIKSTIQSSTLDTMVDVEDMTFNVGANETWLIDVDLMTFCNNTGGTHFAFLFPSGSSFRAAANGNFTSTQGSLYFMWETSTVELTNYNRYSGVGNFRLKGTLTTGATAGVFKITYRSDVAGQSSTVYSESSINARKVE